ncbi:uncharacterized protein LOC110727553 [Chenopodium quinoa]|uniref:uncharacterized protein LOC110727553 n=1 Tax=Chenopodium quinoa TaxID=63459 RepID=UPI000B79080A|nr:uncharacterized protein LOC110727553 [Chenopodium quinoa]
MPKFNTAWLLIAIVITLAEVAATTKMISNSKSIYKVLEDEGLPMGLFPKGITNFSVSEDGKFEVYLDQPCDAKFESELHYEKNVVGQISYGQIGNLTGISAQDLFLWFPVKGIRVDVPSSGVIYFDVGVVHKQFSLSLFETPRECVAATHPITAIADVVAKKLVGVLRFGFDWWTNGGEVM